ncbi:unnamed protein product [Sphagnum troendelagicum]|uniref:Oligopeptide transporter n=1 Tax=Sphagnum troendelagicum TaxID=128251 RepID=A0ABP0V279_9BRYO
MGRGGNEDESPVEQVRLTVPTTDDPTLPVWTFRMWTVGLFVCILLSFFHQFFELRSEPLIISAIAAQVASLPIGKFMAATLPTRPFRLPFTKWEFSLNPGPFNMKEHVLITIFANAGSSFGNGDAYAVGIISITKALYKRKIDFFAGLMVVITTQVLGYGWAGYMRKYLVDPAHMWWPYNLVQVSIFRTLHEPETGKGLKRIQFFVIVLVLSFSYYIFPSYMFMMLTYFSWVCWAWPNSVTAHQIGSGLNGLGIGALSLDWAGIAAFLSSPLVSPFFASVNIIVGFTIVMYIITPATYWLNVYNAKTFPIFSSSLFQANGQDYDITTVVDSNFELNLTAYEEVGNIHLSTFFAMTYGFGFAGLAATVSHVALFYGKEIWLRTRASFKNNEVDVHTRLMRRYKDIPSWWFLILTIVGIGASIGTVEGYKAQLQLPWWGVLFACVLACFFTLPIGVIAATTNQIPGLNVITEYVMGYILPGKPIANVCFKVFGYNSMLQAVSFLQDFKLGHYMKIPPRSMFVVQIIGTIVAAVVNVGVAWWLLTTVENICDINLLPASSPWTCPNDRVFFDASVIWGLVGPNRIFGKLGEYSAINWFWLGGLLAPVPVYILHRYYPKVKLFRLINMPILIGATGIMPPASAVNFTSWFIVAFIFNFLIYRYRKSWWQRYNYVLSGGLDSGVAFLGVFVYVTLQLENKTLNWWGNNVDGCTYATCPTQPGVNITGCPVF